MNQNKGLSYRVNYFVIICMIALIGCSHDLNKEERQVETSIQTSVEKPIEHETNLLTTQMTLGSEKRERDRKTKPTQIINSTHWTNHKIQTAFHQSFDTISGEYSLFYQPIFDTTQPNREFVALVENNQPIRSASIIKLFILLALYYQADQGLIDLDSVYSLKENDRVGGTGILQLMPENEKFTYGELAKWMIIESDNMATNILINRLGGVENIQRLINHFGYQSTQIKRKMLDFQALSQGIDNYTTVMDVGNLLRTIYNKQLLSKEAHEEMLAILGEQRDRSLLVANFTDSIKAYHKTGTFDDYGVKADASILEIEGNVYVLVVLSQGGLASDQLIGFQTFGKAVNNILLQQDDN